RDAVRARRVLRFGGPGGPGEELVLDRLAAQRRGRVAEAKIDVDAPQRLLVGQSAAADVHEVRAFLDETALRHRHRGIRDRGDDVRAAIDILGTIADNNLDAVALAHLAAERLAVRARRAEDLQLRDVAHAAERLHVRARHAAGAEHADHPRVLARHVLHADRAV